MGQPWLILDAGNSRLKFGWWSEGRLFGVETVAWSEDWRWALRRALASRAAGRVVAGRIRHECTAAAMDEIVGQAHAPGLHWLSTQARGGGVVNGYRDARELGIDRWAVLVAVVRRDPADWHLIIDAGTAVTVDVLAPQGRHQGGAIFPGARLLQEALGKGAAGLPPADEATGELPARGTAAGIASGIRYGLAGAIQRLQAEMMTSAEPVVPRVWLTGGDAHWLGPLLGGVPVHQPHLVLEGLARLAEGEP